jgi:hypothetical protein
VECIATDDTTRCVEHNIMADPIAFRIERALDFERGDALMLDRLSFAEIVTID